MSFVIGMLTTLVIVMFAKLYPLRYFNNIRHTSRMRLGYHTKKEL